VFIDRLDRWSVPRFSGTPSHEPSPNRPYLEGRTGLEPCDLLRVMQVRAVLLRPTPYAVNYIVLTDVAIDPSLRHRTPPPHLTALGRRGPAPEALQ
jgi:hypothetical protein